MCPVGLKWLDSVKHCQEMPSYQVSHHNTITHAVFNYDLSLLQCCINLEDTKVCYPPDLQAQVQCKLSHKVAGGIAPGVEKVGLSLKTL